jgi:hypothetical protein
MIPVNNCNATNEMSPEPFLSDEFLKEKYGITEEYSKQYPEDSVQVLLLVRATESALQSVMRSAESEKELDNSMMRLWESNRELYAEIIQSSEETSQALQTVVKSASELGEMTSKIANVANLFFSPLRRGFHFLTGRREATAVLPREDQLAIEHSPENAISNTDSIDEKKNCPKPLKFCMGLFALYLLYLNVHDIFCNLHADSQTK